MDSRDLKAANGKSDSMDDNSENPNASMTKQKRKRRSKNDAEGRSFKCSECGKSYLSQPALTNHKKSKHNYGVNGEKKGRGRPRKNPPLPNSNDNAEKKFQQFFDKDIRKPQSEAVDLECAMEGFKDMFSKYSTLFSSYPTPDLHPFYKLLVSQWDASIDEIKTKTDINCDDIFFLYLRDIAGKTNKDYFHFLFKFTVLFRECINSINKKRSDTDEPGLPDHTQIANAEQVPDTCNEFITEFMDPNDYYGLETSELIEAIQHLCFWLYFSHHTTSRLTLL